MLLIMSPLPCANSPLTAYRYWNRYPGVMCDTEASIYCPLLEETNFMPSHKYAYGNEIREHAERIVRQWKLAGTGVFRTRILDASWDDERARWAIKMETDRGPGSQVSFIDMPIFASHSSGPTLKRTR